ncbi:MAG: DNA-directed RNA polymerase subunit beta' [bacterium ADurb.Bin212]|nr:MAG: DNA-directed RNA polymerase subunit beta' [bacterium ADurb.Bin212]
MPKEKVEIRDQVNVSDFEAVRISVASPDNIQAWSHGEVLKPETINYRTQKPERDGLFCEKIFGPTKDWECYCGKYKKIRYKGVVCDKCGVEVTRSSVRRIRIGHIDLAVPVAHIWYSRGTSPVIAQILGVSSTDLEKVIYFASFIIMEINEEVRTESLQAIEEEYQDMLLEIKNDDASVSEASKELKRQKIDAAYKQAKSELNTLRTGEIISELKYNELTIKYGHIINVGIGAEAILKLLQNVDLDKEIADTDETLKKDLGDNRRRVLKRMKVLTQMKNAEIKPEWLVLSKLPVIPPDLRPMVQLDGGRFAASDLNDLYRRVLNRNNRLKRLLSQGAPEVICRNEKRMLQEAVDAVIDNSARKGKVAMSAGGKRKLRSLSDMIRGKQGRFRQNLLGKRVDYSGRSVIVVGPQLKLNQCGIPKVMALELFKPFVIGKLIKDGYVHNVKNATKLIERGEDFVWDILEEITKDHHVMLNRAPTLHRLGIQAFQPVLIEGKSIQVHPLVCAAFNADFDGDQMAVHVPLSKQARLEASNIMLSSKNLLKPASGDPIVTPEKDMILGLYYLTYNKQDAKGAGKVFASKEAAISAYDSRLIDPQAIIKVRINGEIIETSAGRLLVNDVLPEGFPYQNEVFDKKKVKKSISEVYQKYGKAAAAKLVDDFKDLGFTYAEFSGLTFSVEDITVPEKKDQIISESNSKLDQIEQLYQRGLLTQEERYSKTVELWMESSSQVEGAMMESFDKENDIFIIMNSGARGNVSQLNQIAGMKGLVADPTGNIIELPIKSNFKEGLSVFEYFVSTHGSRKGRADTALRTSEAGYLTRRLVDVSQDTVVTEHDCGTIEYRTMSKDFYENAGKSWNSHILGRVLAEDCGSVTAGTMIDESVIATFDQNDVKEIKIRSLLGCQSKRGICQVCYGKDPATGDLVEIGTTVGIVAAQAIGEPGTQLTMRTFHTGGAAGEDITTGLPRVQELFESRTPKFPAVVADFDGKVTITRQENNTVINVTGKTQKSEVIVLPVDYGWTVKDGDKVKVKQPIAEAEDQKPIRANTNGVVKITDNKATISGEGVSSRDYMVSNLVQLKVSDNQEVTAGQPLTEGHLDLASSIKLRGVIATQNYIIDEVQQIYDSQGQDINDKHVEVIVRQMCSKIKILDPADSQHLAGQIVELSEVLRQNAERKSNNQPLIKYENIIMGISRVALRTRSFLAAASFMETTSVLIDAAISGKIDKLEGLKENIIIGKLIPAGTGIRSDFIDTK